MKVFIIIIYKYIWLLYIYISNAENSWAEEQNHVGGRPVPGSLLEESVRI